MASRKRKNQQPLGEWRKWGRSRKAERAEYNCINQRRVLPSILHFIYGPHSITTRRVFELLMTIMASGWSSALYTCTHLSTRISPSPSPLPNLTVQTSLCWKWLAPQKQFGIIPSNSPPPPTIYDPTQNEKLTGSDGSVVKDDRNFYVLIIKEPSGMAKNGNLPKSEKGGHGQKPLDKKWIRHLWPHWVRKPTFPKYMFECDVRNSVYKCQIFLPYQVLFHSTPAIILPACMNWLTILPSKSLVSLTESNKISSSKLYMKSIFKLVF